MCPYPSLQTLKTIKKHSKAGIYNKKSVTICPTCLPGSLNPSFPEETCHYKH